MNSIHQIYCAAKRTAVVGLKFGNFGDRLSNHELYSPSQISCLS